MLCSCRVACDLLAGDSSAPALGYATVLFTTPLSKAGFPQVAKLESNDRREIGVK